MGFGSFFGKKDKPKEAAAASSASGSDPIDIDAIRRFLPIRLLPDRVISYLAGRSSTTRHAKGNTLFKPGHSFDEAIFLLSGTIGYLHEGKVNSTLSTTDTQSNFAIISGGACTEEAVAVENVTLLHVPQDLIKAAQEMADLGTPTDIGLKMEDEDSSEHKIHVELLEKAKSGNINLPSMPDIAIRIGKTIDNPNTGSLDIARIIQLDPSLTARLVQVVNSPVYAGRGHIENCPDAVTRLGRETTRNLVISFLLRGLFRSKSPILQKVMNEIWHFSTHVGALCHVLARMTPGLDPDRAMLAGLIHNIGAVVIVNEAKHYPDIAKSYKMLYATIHHLAPEIGGIILQQWNFGDDLTNVVLHASDWLRDTEGKPDYIDLTLVARLHAFVGSPRIHSLPRLDLVPAFHKLALGQLTPQLSVAVLDKAEHDIKSVQKLLNS